MRRDYGSLLPELVDAPQNETLRQLMIASTVKAITRWERRISIIQTTITFSAIGQCIINIVAQRNDDETNSNANSSANRNANSNERVRFTIPIQNQNGNPIFA